MNYKQVHTNPAREYDQVWDTKAEAYETAPAEPTEIPADLKKEGINPDKIDPIARETPTKTSKTRKPTPYTKQDHDADYLLRSTIGVMQAMMKDHPIHGYSRDDLGQCDAAETYLHSAIRYAPEIGWLVYHPAKGVWVTEYADMVVSCALKVLAAARSDLSNIYGNELKDAMRYAVHARGKRNIKDVQEMLSLAPRVYSLGKEYDADKIYLNTEKGCFDLETGQMYASRPGFMCRKVTGVAPKSMPTPHFHRFLDEITCGDAQLALWISRWLGYCLTGNVQSAYFANFFGQGRNGKGTLIRLMLKIMGSYAVSLNPKAVVLQRGEPEGRFDIANLPGARLAAVEDVPKGRLAEGMIKNLTGEGYMVAEEKYKAAFRFEPIAKLVLSSNHQLALRDTGPSMKRRLRAIPFAFTPEHIDPALEDRLWEEAPGILDQLIFEAGLYLKYPGPQGFPPCPAIDKASDEYIASQDTITNFLADKTQPGDGVKASDLYSAYKVWCDQNGEKALTSTLFGTELRVKHAIDKKRNNQGQVYTGIAIIP